MLKKIDVRIIFIYDKWHVDNFTGAYFRVNVILLTSNYSMFNQTVSVEVQSGTREGHNLRNRGPTVQGCDFHPNL